jgi:hypothetical protein
MSRLAISVFNFLSRSHSNAVSFIKYNVNSNNNDPCLSIDDNKFEQDDIIFYCDIRLRLDSNKHDLNLSITHHITNMRTKQHAK